MHISLVFENSLSTPGISPGSRGTSLHPRISSTPAPGSHVAPVGSSTKGICSKQPQLKTVISSPPGEPHLTQCWHFLLIATSRERHLQPPFPTSSFLGPRVEVKMGFCLCLSQRGPERPQPGNCAPGLQTFISAVSRRGLGACPPSTCPSGPAGTNSLALYENCGYQDSRSIKDSRQQPKGKGDGNKFVLRANYAFGKVLEFR